MEYRGSRKPESVIIVIDISAKMLIETKSVWDITAILSTEWFRYKLESNLATIHSLLLKPGIEYIEQINGSLNLGVDPHEGPELKSLGFTYTGPTGPRRWGSLNPHFSACYGKEQSPLNIVKDQVIRSRSFKPLTRTYLALNATLYSNGFNIGVHFDGQIAGTLVIDGKNYNLKQLHWHTPSEHRINGVQFPAELHLVHIADDNSIAVVAILLRYGKEDPFISQMKDKMAELTEEVCRRDNNAHVPLGHLDMKEFDKRTRKYWRYVGSLSSPPCTENVTWNILGKVRYISKAQVEALRAPLVAHYKNNARPLQPLNGRKIELLDELN